MIKIIDMHGKSKISVCKTGQIQIEYIIYIVNDGCIILSCNIIVITSICNPITVHVMFCNALVTHVL